MKVEKLKGLLGGGNFSAAERLKNAYTLFDQAAIYLDQLQDDSNNSWILYDAVCYASKYITKRVSDLEDKLKVKKKLIPHHKKIMALASEVCTVEENLTICRNILKETRSMYEILKKAEIAGKEIDRSSLIGFSEVVHDYAISLQKRSEGAQYIEARALLYAAEAIGILYKLTKEEKHGKRAVALFGYAKDYYQKRSSSDAKKVNNTIKSETSYLRGLLRKYK